MSDIILYAHGWSTIANDPTSGNRITEEDRKM